MGLGLRLLLGLRMKEDRESFMGEGEGGGVREERVGVGGKSKREKLMLTYCLFYDLT